MESSEQRKLGEIMRLTIEVPQAIVAWLAELKYQMGIRSRSVIIEGFCASSARTHRLGIRILRLRLSRMVEITRR